MKGILKTTCFLWILLTMEVLPASSRSHPIPRSALREQRSINMGYRPLQTQKSMFPVKYENSIVRKGAEKTSSFLVIIIPKDATFRKRLPSKQELKDRRLKYMKKEPEFGYKEYAEPKQSVDENTTFEFVGQPRAFKFSDLVA